MSIRQRVALQITLVMLGAFVILTAAASWTTLVTTESTLAGEREKLLGPALRERAAERELLEAPSAGAFLTALRAARQDATLPVAAVSFVDGVGRVGFRDVPPGNDLDVLADPGKLPLPDPAIGRYEADVHWPAGGPTRGRVALQFALPPPPQVGTIVAHTLTTHGLVFAFCTVLLVVSTYFLLNRVVLRPLDALAAASRRVAEGDYQVRVAEPQRQDEIAGLMRTFNQMTAEVRGYHTEMERRVMEATEKIRAAERKMVLTQRLASMGTLAAGIAHEVNNPIGGMINAARRLQDDVPEGRPTTYVELLLDGLERVQNTVKQVLSFTPRTVHPEPVHLPDIARKAIELGRHRIDKNDIALANELPDDLPAIVGEPSELQQVFLNLIINAADATERGGHIVLQGRAVPGAVELEVIDTGSGMTEEQISRAFDIFYTTKGQGEGTGLGLPIVHNIVQSHGGSLEIQSTVGEGTKVKLRFPLPDAPGGESRRLAATPPEAL